MRYELVNQALNLQIQFKSIENDDDIRLSLVYIEKMQNTTNVEILTLIKVVIDRKGLDISVKNEI